MVFSALKKLLLELLSGILPENTVRGPGSLTEKNSTEVSSGPVSWSATNGRLRDGGLRKFEDIWGKRPFSSLFWISHVLFGPSGKGRKREKKGGKGRKRPISRKGGQTPLKPLFVTPPFAAPQVRTSPALARNRGFLPERGSSGNYFRGSCNTVDAEKARYTKKIGGRRRANHEVQTVNWEGGRLGGCREGCQEQPDKGA